MYDITMYDITMHNICFYQGLPSMNLWLLIGKPRELEGREGVGGGRD